VRRYRRPHMARGQSGSLFLLCTTLSFATSCRFIPALSGCRIFALGMVLPIGLLIIRVGFAPLSAAIADHLGVNAIALALTPPVFIASPRLAFQPATHFLIRAAWGRLKGLLAIRAAARLEDHFLRGVVSAPTLRKSEVPTRCRVCYRVLTASPPLGSLACGATGSGQDRLKWRPFSPSLTKVHG
jgi:hypothetical protein